VHFTGTEIIDWMAMNSYDALHRKKHAHFEEQDKNLSVDRLHPYCQQQKFSPWVFLHIVT